MSSSNLSAKIDEYIERKSKELINEEFMDGSELYDYLKNLLEEVWENGYDSGYDEGYSEGHSNGESEGWEEGYHNAMMEIDN